MSALPRRKKVVTSATVGDYPIQVGSHLAPRPYTFGREIRNGIVGESSFLATRFSPFFAPLRCIATIVLRCPLLPGIEHDGAEASWRQPLPSIGLLRRSHVWRNTFRKPISNLLEYYVLALYDAHQRREAL